jgi:hypothetical protein
MRVTKWEGFMKTWLAKFEIVAGHCPRWTERKLRTAGLEFSFKFVISPIWSYLLERDRRKFVVEWIGLNKLQMINGDLLWLQ